MASAYIGDLKARRDWISGQLAALEDLGVGKPNITAGTGGGASVQNVEQRDAWYRELKQINELLADALKSEAAQDDAWDFATEAST